MIARLQNTAKSLRAIARGLLAWSVVAILCVLVWLSLVRPLAQHFIALQSRADMAQAQIARLEERLSGNSSVITQLPDDLIYQGLSAPIATAQLLSSVTDAIARAGGRAQSTLGQQPDPLEAGQIVSVRVDAEMSVAALAELLFEIETIRPLAVVDLLDISARQEEAPEDGSQPVPLSVRLVVASLLSEEG